MLYFLLKPIVTLALRIYFRKIHFSGKERVPEGYRLIYAVNHPTAFLDPIIVATHEKRVFHFMLRGDIFVSNLIIKLLHSIKTIPIFRQRDGIANLRKNEATMERVYSILDKGKEHILILAEGLTKHEKRLRKIQKGTARMAFGTYQQYGHENICIVPIGVNYTDAHQFRSTVMVEYGEPIFLKDYLEIHAQNDRRAIKKMTDEIQRRMRQLIIHVEQPEDDILVNHLLAMHRHDRDDKLFPTHSKDGTLLREEWAITEEVNQMPAAEKESLKKLVDTYYRRLHEYRVTDMGLSQPKYASFGDTVRFILGIVPYWIGSIWNWLPLRFAKRVADKKVKSIEFHASVRFGVGLFAWLGYFLLWFILVGIFACWACAPLVFLMPLFGFYALIFREFCAKRADARDVQALTQEVRMKLRAKRKRIMGAVN